MLRTVPVAAVLLVAADVPGGLETKLIEYGVIGIMLLTFVYWSRTDKEKSDAKWAETNAQMFDMIRAQTAALTESTEALREQTESQKETNRLQSELNNELRGRPCMIAENKRR
jgi:hypothetical protein